MTLPARFTRTTIEIVPEMPLLLALEGYCGMGRLSSVPASGPPVDGNWPSLGGFAPAFASDDPVALDDSEAVEALCVAEPAVFDAVTLDGPFADGFGATKL